MNTKLNGILYAQGFSNQKNGERLYIKLADAIAQSLVEKKLGKGNKMPPTRLLALDLGVSRSTVIKAYELLAIKLYIYSIQGSGYYVNDIRGKVVNNQLENDNQPQLNTPVSRRARNFSSKVNLINRSIRETIAFRPGLPPLDIFPVRQWQNLTNNYWRKVTVSDMSYLSPSGLDSLRRSIADYVHMYRNIRCSPDQIVVVTGSLHSLSLVGDLIIDENDQVVFENPSYPNAIAIFKSLGAKILTTSIDEEGMNIAKIKKKKSLNPKLIYTTPSNQYPTGVQMSQARRIQLLEWAHRYNSLIIEDDYDHEFSNWSDPIPSIFSLDNHQRVIYHGTFNKLLHPSIRLGYIILPKYLVKDMTSLVEQSFRFVAPETQKVMSDFIEKDYLSKHIRNVVQVSKERRRIFIDCFQKHCTKHMNLNKTNNGLHLVAHMEDTIDDIALSKHLQSNGIIAFPYSKYFLKKPKKKGLVMGFSSVRAALIKSYLKKMATLVNSYLDS